MKILKYTFALMAAVVISTQLSAQCVPDSNEKYPGIFPDTIQNLDTAVVGNYYEMVLTAVVPKDTLFFGNRIPIDSIGISKFEGLPSGFTATANSASSYWKGGSSGCLVIQGTPTSGDVGVYPLTIQVIAVVAGTPAPYPVPGYKLVIEGNSGYLHKEISNNSIAFPNPFQEITNIRFTSLYSENLQLQVFNTNGSIIHSSTHNTTIGMNEVSFQNKNYPEGLYFYSLTSKNYYITNTFLIKY